MSQESHQLTSTKEENEDGLIRDKNEHLSFNDMDMIQFEQSIRDEEANAHPLVSLKEDLSSLMAEYLKGSEIFVKKIEDLNKKYTKLRRCRGDGNCFYRAFLFSLYEKLLNGTQESYNQFYKKIEQSTEVLKRAGFEPIVIEDFYDITLEQLQAINPTKNNHNDDISKQDLLLTVFQSDEVSNAIVVYFRFLTSAYLKLNADHYLPFIIDDPILSSFSLDNNDPTSLMAHYCNLNVEAMGKESDEIHITVLATFLELPIRVAYLDSYVAIEEEPVINFLDYSTTSSKEKGFVDSPITLLYRPGHYDILYE